MCGIDFVPPFQGLKICCHETQGVALGCHVIALSAREFCFRIFPFASPRLCAFALKNVYA
jgi:hypothetical protein